MSSAIHCAPVSEAPPPEWVCTSAAARDAFHALLDRAVEEVRSSPSKCREHGSVAKACKTFQTTAVTPTKALDRRHIVQRWMVEGEGSGNGGGR